MVARTKDGGAWCGLLAAWFLALSFQHVEGSHYITVDVQMTLFAFWAVVMVVEDVEERLKIEPLLVRSCRRVCCFEQQVAYVHQQSISVSEKFRSPRVRDLETASFFKNYEDR